MFNLLLALLIACGGPTPASIKFEGEQIATVHKLDAVAAPTAVVLDAAGAKIEGAPEVKWEVTPAEVAKLDGGKIVPLANGEATIKATVGEVHAEYKMKVALPDKVALSGYNAGDAFQVGEKKAMTAKVMAGEEAVEGEAVTWSSSDNAIATVDDKGEVTAVAAGTAKITAKSGALEASADVTITAAAAEVADGAEAPAAP